MRSQILLPLAVLAFCGAVLPVRLPAPVALASPEMCGTDGDAPPPALTRQQLEECSALDPSDVELLADLAAAYESDGAVARAEEVYRRAVVAAPDDGELRLRLGRLLLRRGKVEEAARQAAAGLEVQPNRRALLDVLRDAEPRP